MPSTLGVLGDPSAIPALLAALHDDEPTVVKLAAQALGELRARDAVKTLGRLLSGDIVPRKLQEWPFPYQGVRQAAAWALADIGGPEATEVLYRSLFELNDEVQFAAALAVGGTLHDPIALSVLISYLTPVIWEGLGNQKAVQILSVLGELGPLAGDLLPALQRISTTADAQRYESVLRVIRKIHSVPEMEERRARRR